MQGIEPGISRFPDAQIAHLRSGPSDHPGMTSLKRNSAFPRRDAPELCVILFPSDNRGCRKRRVTVAPAATSHTAPQSASSPFRPRALLARERLQWPPVAHRRRPTRPSGPIPPAPALRESPPDSTDPGSAPQEESVRPLRQPAHGGGSHVTISRPAGPALHVDREVTDRESAPGGWLRRTVPGGLAVSPELAL